MFVCWIFVGVIRFFGSDSKYGYSMHHAYFNETYVMTVFWGAVHNGLFQIFTEIFEFEPIGLDQQLWDTISFFGVVILSLRSFIYIWQLFLSDFAVEYQGIPKIT